MSSNNNSGLSAYDNKLGPKQVISFCILSLENSYGPADQETACVLAELRKWKERAPSRSGLTPKWVAPVKPTKKPKRGRDMAIQLF